MPKRRFQHLLKTLATASPSVSPSPPALLLLLLVLLLFPALLLLLLVLPPPLSPSDARFRFDPG